MKKLLLKVAFLGLIISTTFNEASANIISTFTDEASFLSSIDGSIAIMESFEDLESNTSLGGLSLNNFTIIDNTSYQSNNYSYRSASVSSSTDGESYLVTYMNPGDSFTFNFNYSIKNLGVNIDDFATNGGPATMSFADSFGNSHIFTPGTQNEFLGVISDVGFTSATFTKNGGNTGDYVGWDEFYYSASTPVPEPSTFILFGGGMLGLVWYGRKRNGYLGNRNADQKITNIAF